MELKVEDASFDKDATNVQLLYVYVCMYVCMGMYAYVCLCV